MKTILIMIFAGAMFQTAKANMHEPDSAAKKLEIEILEINHPSCPYKEDGNVCVNVNGGIPPYTYNWNTFPNQYDHQAKGLASGKYFVHVTDAVGNTSFLSVELQNKFSEKECIWLNNNYIEVHPEVFPAHEAQQYNYELNGQNMKWEDVTALDPGIYNLNISNGDDCKMSRVIQIFEYSN